MKQYEPPFRADDVTTLALRVLLALLFGIAGANKLRDIGGFGEAIHQQFDQTILAGPLLSLFIAVLPFVEVVLGALLLLGWMTRWTLVAAAATLLVLFFGKSIAHDGPTCAYIALYLFLALVALRNADNNRYSVDHLMRPEG